MQNLSFKLASSFVLAATTFSLSTFAEKVNAATMVDLELGLVIDASGSFIEPGDKKQIAVSAFLFGGDVRQEIGWTLINNQNASTTFGNAFENITRDTQIQQFTDTDRAISTAANSISSNNFDAEQQTLDISTDGFPTEAPDGRILTEGEIVKAASQNALNGKVDAINAIGILGSGGLNSQYLEDFVIGGKNGNDSNAFVLTANGFDEFTATLENKIKREVVTEPDPDPVTPTPTPPVTPNPTPTPPVDPNTGAVPEPSMMLGILAAGVMRQRLAKHLKRQKK
jgi:hypothetical protein